MNPAYWRAPWAGTQLCDGVTSLRVHELSYTQQTPTHTILPHKALSREKNRSPPSHALSTREISKKTVSQGTKMFSSPPLLHPSELRLPREGLLPTILCFLPPTFAFGLPAHQHAGNHRSGFHGNSIMGGGDPQNGWNSLSGTALVVPRVLLPHPWPGNHS